MRDSCCAAAPAPAPPASRARRSRATSCAWTMRLVARLTIAGRAACPRWRTRRRCGCPCAPRRGPPPPAAGARRRGRGCPGARKTALLTSGAVAAERSSIGRRSAAIAPAEALAHPHAEAGGHQLLQPHRGAHPQDVPLAQQQRDGVHRLGGLQHHAQQPGQEGVQVLRPERRLGDALERQEGALARPGIAGDGGGHSSSNARLKRSTSHSATASSPALRALDVLAVEPQDAGAQGGVLAGHLLQVEAHVQPLQRMELRRLRQPPVARPGGSASTTPATRSSSTGRWPPSRGFGRPRVRWEQAHRSLPVLLDAGAVPSDEVVQVQAAGASSGGSCSPYPEDGAARREAAPAPAPPGGPLPGRQHPPCAPPPAGLPPPHLVTGGPGTGHADRWAGGRVKSTAVSCLLLPPTRATTASSPCLDCARLGDPW